MPAIFYFAPHIAYSRGLSWRARMFSASASRSHYFPRSFDFFSTMGIAGWILGAVVVAAVSGLTQGS
jgi:hypothetical protein